MKLVEGDCEEYLTKMQPVKCIFMDPPDNIGLKYANYNDNRVDYFSWLARLVSLALSRSKILWLSYHQKHDLDVARILNTYVGSRITKKIIWRYTFGQYNDKDFASGYRPIWLIREKNAETFGDRIREESERMRLGDARTVHREGRHPDDVWDFPRVVGNSPGRRSWHPTQHPVILYDRVMKYSCGTGDEFVDLFAGSGTCFYAGRLNPDVKITGVEIDSEYCKHLRADHMICD